MPLPQFLFNITGIQDNIVFDDSGLKGAKLNFSRGLDIFGETAFVYISLQFSVCRLYHVKTQYKHVNIQNGLYSEVVDEAYSRQTALIANQPEGNICMVAPALRQHPNNTKNCDPIYNPSAISSSRAVA